MVNKLLKIENEEEQEYEKDRLKVEAKTEEGVTEIDVELWFTLATTDREAIVNEIVARSQLSREEIEKVLELKAEEEEKELGIEVEIEYGIANVKIEIGDDEQEFTLETTDKEAILSEIASRLGVTVEQIRNLVEFEEKDAKSGKKVKVEDEEEIEFDEKEDKETLEDVEKELEKGKKSEDNKNEDKEEEK